MKTFLFALAFLLHCFLVFGQQEPIEGITPQPERTPSPVEVPTPRPGETIYEVISRIPELSQLTNLVEETGFRLFLDSPYSQITLFAPTNEAFQMFRERERQEGEQTGTPMTGEQTGTPMNGEQTGTPMNGEQGEQNLRDTQLLAYHIGSPSRSLQSFENNELFFTAGGLPVRINRYEDMMIVTVNGALVQADTSASNGQIIIIDQVLTPPNVTLFEIPQQREDFSMFAQLLQNADPQIMQQLMDPSASLTLFIPSNQALQNQDMSQLQSQEEISNFVRRFISNQVLYSVALYNGRTVQTESGESFNINIQDDSLLLGDAPLSEVDINAVNGVAHVLRQVPSFMGTPTPGSE